mgnify:CR=1 FL=1
MVGELPAETELSQVFIAISLDSFKDKETLEANIDATLQDMKTSAPVLRDVRFTIQVKI